MSKCTAITRGGTRCKGTAIDSSGYCHAHHPDRAEMRRRAASKGGKTGGRGRPIEGVRETRALLRSLAGGVLNKRVDRADAAVAGQLLNCVLRSFTVEAQMREQEELVERMERLESSLEQHEERRGA
jgi:hypothetical protein